MTEQEEYIKSLENEIEEMNVTFNLMHQANMTAIKMWQEETGENLTWPNHVDLVAWLLRRLESAEGSTKDQR